MNVAGDTKALRAFIAGIRTLLINFDEDRAAGRYFTSHERQNVTAVSAWLKAQKKT